MRSIVDCRQDNRLANNFLELSLWGKPCYAYVIEAVNDAGCFSDIGILTEEEKIVEYCEKHYPFVNVLEYSQAASFNGTVFTISGRAPCISSMTIKDAVSSVNGSEVVSSRSVSGYDVSEISFYGGLKQEKFNAFHISGRGLMNGRNYAFFPVPDKEAVVVNSANDFELALVLKKKQENRLLVVQMIDRIIHKKDSILKNGFDDKSICLVGHSQLDQWTVQDIAGYRVRNCGVSGISSFEYHEKILQEEKLNCKADVFLVMHGTNDIVWDYTIEEMVDSINKTIDYIRERNTYAPILYLSCLHVNGRFDRNNARIDELNAVLREELNHSVAWVGNSFMDDKYGNLDERYTKDGLHITEEGYEVLENEIVKTIEEIGL